MKKVKTLSRFIFIAGMAMSLIHCTENKGDDYIPDEAPEIVFEGAIEDVFQVKTGQSILLEPIVKHNEKASYRWLINGITVGRQESYLFSPEGIGRHYITFEVTNPAATVSKEIRVDVVDFMYPEITLPIPQGGFIMLTGTQREFEPVVANSDGASFGWFVNEEKTADTKDFVFNARQKGEYSILFRAENEDGIREAAFNISVREAEDIPFRWEWEKDVYYMTAGRTAVLGPLSVENSLEAVYTWRLDGTVVQESKNQEYLFKPSSTGKYVFTISRENEYGMFPDHTITVEVFDNEFLNLRPVTAGSVTDMTKVWDYKPAPGQFINMGNYDSQQKEIEAAFSRLSQNLFVSLGAFGGYIVAGFDHSIINDGGYNIRILGNSFSGSSEPGVVWVMQDENGDGLPNDTWYELKGSEYGKSGTIQNYAVTYYRPSGARMDTPWSDNQGGSGVVEANRFHTQDFYYPGWIETDSYTLRGTRLADNVTYDGMRWVMKDFAWGYADNFGSDMLTDDENYEADVNANHFRIRDAVDAAGNSVDLKYIDFVKVQSAVQGMAGILGEVSTEVFGLQDFNMLKNQ